MVFAYYPVSHFIRAFLKKINILFLEDYIGTGRNDVQFCID